MLKSSIKIIAVVALIPFAGCSVFMRTESPRYRPEQREPSCSGPILPVVDTTAAAAFALTSASIFSEKEEFTCQTPGCGVDAALYATGEGARILGGLMTAAIATIYAVSAIHGYKNASRCSDVWSERHAWERGNPHAKEETFVPQLPPSGLGSACQAHEQCGPGNGCDPTTHTCVELP